MAYQIWEAIHNEMGQKLGHIYELGRKLSVEQGVERGDLKFLRADAVSSYLYDSHHA